MVANINYRGLQCPALSKILQSKGIQHSNKKKDELVDLCEGAQALKLPDIDKNNDDSEAAVLRRTVKGKTYPDPLDQQNQLSWTMLICCFNVTCNDISVIYVTVHSCAGGLKKKFNIEPCHSGGMAEYSITTYIRVFFSHILFLC